jgi:hypothetical protein
MRPISRSVVVSPSESFSILKVTFFFSQVPRLNRCTLSATWNSLNQRRFRFSSGPLFRRLLKTQPGASGWIAFDLATYPSIEAISAQPLSKRSNRKAVTPSSPRLPLRLPWVGNGLSPNRNAVASRLTRGRNDATALRLDNHFIRSQGSRGGNPGLEDTTALRFSNLPTSLCEDPGLSANGAKCNSLGHRPR